jgi:hypothetical protein
MGPDATTNCERGFGGSVRCETRVREKTLPPPRLECSGGDVVSTLTSVTTRNHYELLTADEVAIRDNPSLPPDRRANDATAVARRFEGLR